MSEASAPVRQTVSKQILLTRLQQSEQMREFFIQMWMQNPGLAKQGGAKVQSLMTRLDQVDAIDQVSVSSGAGMTKQRGVSLVELIMFIVIVSVALTGIVLVMNVTTRHSADPLIHKQALAIAESLLEEVEMMPFTYCDPDDASAVTATAAVVGGTGCATTVESMGPETAQGESRLGAVPYDNVNDYDGYNVPVVADITGATGVAGYPASIAITPVPLFGIAATDANGAAQVLQITVTVTGPDTVPIKLDGYRTRYSPDSGP